MDTLIGFAARENKTGRKSPPENVTMEDKNRIDLFSLFSQFIIAIGSFVQVTPHNTEFMQEMMILCQLYLKCIQRHASEYVGKRSEDMSQASISEEDNIQACHKLANKFVVDCFPVYLKDLKK